MSWRFATRRFFVSYAEIGIKAMFNLRILSDGNKVIYFDSQEKAMAEADALAELLPDFSCVFVSEVLLGGTVLSSKTTSPRKYIQTHYVAARP